MISLKQMAVELKVSRGAISHVLNGRGHKLSAPTRKRILKALSAHDYRSNALVRSLRTQRTRVIGIVVPSVKVSFFPDLVNAIESEAKDGGYQCFLCQSHSSTETLKKEIAMLREHRVDGMVVFPVNSFEQQDFYRQLRQLAVRFILMGQEVEGVEAPLVVNDEMEAGRLGTQHLLELGHRRIAHVRGHWGSLNARNRFKGYRLALRQARVGMDKNLVVGDGFELKNGQQAARTLMEQKAEFTALVASNDLVAIGAIQELRRAGLRVPEDVSVVGCSNLDLCELVSPPLTTVDQRPSELGGQAMRLLMEQIERGITSPKRVTVDPVLVVRGSAVRI